MSEASGHGRQLGGRRLRAMEGSSSGHGGRETSGHGGWFTFRLFTSHLRPGQADQDKQKWARGLTAFTLAFHLHLRRTGFPAQGFIHWGFVPCRYAHELQTRWKWYPVMARWLWAPVVTRLRAPVCIGRTYVYTHCESCVRIVGMLSLISTCIRTVIVYTHCDLSLYLYTYIYIRIYIYVCLYVCIYIRICYNKMWKFEKCEISEKPKYASRRALPHGGSQRSSR